MPLVNLREILQKAASGAYAVGAFNIFDQLCMQAVVDAAVALKSPLIIQVLPPVVRQFGSRSIAAWARTLADLHPEIPMVLHLDHGRDRAMVAECIHSGWTSVMIDASDRALGDNIELTRQVIDKARRAGVTVEGEVGCIFSVEESREIREKKENLADTDACRLYCAETQVDALAPAIGTAHGLYRDKPNLDCGRLRAIRAALKAFLVIHGGTGLTPEDFRQLIECGANKINIATQLAVEYCRTLRQFATGHPDSNDPGEFFALVRHTITETVKGFIQVFGSAGKV